jgi:hypothetical protein
MGRSGKTKRPSLFDCAVLLMWVLVSVRVEVAFGITEPV